MTTIQIIIQWLTLFGVGYVIFLDLKIGKKRNKLRELEMKIFKKDIDTAQILDKNEVLFVLNEKYKC